ncbi:MAG TPA: MaoC family dehydratase [Syntrophomonadaceae bacterium]|nr:MaoC family dehydratase [Syntrophomonadaceae bacterium]
MDIGKTINEIQIGDAASFSKTISETDVYLFAGITGDFNPMHMNEEYAKITPFKTRIAHGPIAACLIAPVLGLKLPGLGTIAVESSSRYLAPTMIGDTITARGEVTAKDEKKNLVTMKLTFTNQHGTVVIDGQAVVMPPLEKFRDKVKDL